MRPLVVLLVRLADRRPQVVQRAVNPQVDPLLERPVEVFNLALRLRVYVVLKIQDIIGKDSKFLSKFDATRSERVEAVE